MIRRGLAGVGLLLAITVGAAIARHFTQAQVESLGMHATRYLWAAIAGVAVVTVYVVLSHLTPKKEY